MTGGHGTIFSPERASRKGHKGYMGNLGRGGSHGPRSRQQASTPYPLVCILDDMRVGELDDMRVGELRFPNPTGSFRPARSCTAVVLGKDGLDLLANVGEDFLDATVLVDGCGGADVDDRVDHPCQRRCLLEVNPFVTG